MKKKHYIQLKQKQKKIMNKLKNQFKCYLNIF